MNYKEFQKKQMKESQVLPGDPKKFTKKHRQPGDYSHIWDFLSDAANPLNVLAVISMFVFFKNFPIIPAIFSALTLICFSIRYKRNLSPGWIVAIWIFNTSMWIFNSIIKI